MWSNRKPCLWNHQHLYRVLPIATQAIILKSLLAVGIWMEIVLNAYKLRYCSSANTLCSPYNNYSLTCWIRTLWLLWYSQGTLRNICMDFRDPVAVEFGSLLPKVFPQIWRQVFSPTSLHDFPSIFSVTESSIILTYILMIHFHRSRNVQ